MNETDSAPPPLPTTAINLVPAGFIIRVLAHVIDSVLWMGILAALVMALFGDELMAYANETLAQAGAGSLSLDRPSPLPVWFNVLFQYVIPVVVLFGETVRGADARLHPAHAADGVFASGVVIVRPGADDCAGRFAAVAAVDVGFYLGDHASAQAGLA
jgi:hypothetical protein